MFAPIKVAAMNIGRLMDLARQLHMYNKIRSDAELKAEQQKVKTRLGNLNTNDLVNLLGSLTDAETTASYVTPDMATLVGNIDQTHSTDQTNSLRRLDADRTIRTRLSIFTTLRPWGQTSCPDDAARNREMLTKTIRHGNILTNFHKNVGRKPRW